MRRIYLPLFWKFAISIIIIVAVFGSVNLYLIKVYAGRGIKEETVKRLQFYAEIVATEASLSLSLSDYRHIPDIINSIKQIDSSVAYAMVIPGKNQPVIHNLPDSVTTEMIKANGLKNGSKQLKILRSPEIRDTIILDIAVPIPGLKEGLVRIGLFRASIRSQVWSIIKPLIFMIVIFLIIGIFGALFFSFVITNRVSSIAKITEYFTFQNLKNRNIPVISGTRLLPGFPHIFQVDDELDVLIEKINQMTDRLKKAYADLEKTYARFVQTEKLASIGVLSAGIAHEINNPVAGILNCIHRIKTHPDDTKKNAEYINLIEDAVNKTEKVVGRLLDYSRSPQSTRESLNPGTSIEKALLLVAYRLEKSRISVIKKIPPDIPAILGNRNELEQVFVNLLLNGIDAIDEHALQNFKCDRRITIEVGEKTGSIIIRLTDTGIGMYREQREKIYDPFYTTKDTGKGTGLGLYVVYNIVHSHNGSIYCESQPGEGTTFVLNFDKIGKDTIHHVR
ncbi:GHKL domain-containing protein [candidate division KSB1 bacterium]|nr:GHKL domain-containing protein [candidate division KSB1 bacterium]